jgi:ribosomal protein S18 acetylase RimI-like enzyme
MAEIDIRRLERMTSSDFKRIVTGYTTTQTYAVHRIESLESIMLSLDLCELDVPFVKTYQHASTQIAYYRELLREGLSVGAYDGTQLIGIGIADRQDWNGTLILWEFHVASDYRGRGIGRRMMDRLIETASQNYLRAISAETQNTNVPAIRFYRKLGFTLESVDLSYYGNDDLARGEVAVFMKRKIIPSPPAPLPQGEG